MKILVADDDPFFRRLLEKVLAPDFEVETANDGVEAWEAIQRAEVPLLVILDWVMPGLSGPQVCREVRAHANTATTYLILLTSRNSSPDILAGLRAGADDYITKPFEPEELRARVRGGCRIIDLQQEVASVRTELEASLLREQGLQARLDLRQEILPAVKLAKGASA